MQRNPLAKPARADADVHLYIDMSGGIQPFDWIPVVADEVESLRDLAAQLGKPVILRMTAFSHGLADDSAPIEVTAAYPSDGELADLIHAIPKASGGTDFHVVYDRINSDDSRGDRRNIIVSDLQWGASPSLLNKVHPVNLEYLAVSNTRPVARGKFMELLVLANLPESHPII